LSNAFIAMLITERYAAGRSQKLVGAKNLRHQAIFVNHAPGAIAPPDAEVVQVGDAI
jgi:hypothetical protein